METGAIIIKSKIGTGTFIFINQRELLKNDQVFKLLKLFGFCNLQLQDRIRIPPKKVQIRQDPEQWFKASEPIC